MCYFRLTEFDYESGVLLNIFIPSVKRISRGEETGLCVHDLTRFS